MQERIEQGALYNKYLTLVKPRDKAFNPRPIASKIHSMNSNIRGQIIFTLMDHFDLNNDVETLELLDDAVYRHVKLADNITVYKLYVNLGKTDRVFNNLRLKLQTGKETSLVLLEIDNENENAMTTIFRDLLFISSSCYPMSAIDLQSQYLVKNIDYILNMYMFPIVASIYVYHQICMAVRVNPDLEEMIRMINEELKFDYEISKDVKKAILHSKFCVFEAALTDMLKDIDKEMNRTGITAAEVFDCGYLIPYIGIISDSILLKEFVDEKKVKKHEKSNTSS